MNTVLYEMKLFYRQKKNDVQSNVVKHVGIKELFLCLLYYKDIGIS